MIHNGISPYNIILFTFTNKAAREIKERVINIIGEKGHNITVGTYHSVCARLLRKYADRIGYSNKFTIFDTDDSLSILKKLCKHTSYDPKVVAAYISNMKSKQITSEQACRMENGPGEKLAMLYRTYQSELKKQDAMDFDDLIGNMIKVLETCEDVKKELNDRYRYVTADEFHDSSRKDIRLIELLAGDDQNVCMILDPDQSIYGFRGADLESVLGVNTIFKNLKTFVLNRNYRSTQTIVNASVSLIEHNSENIKKQLYSKNEVGDKLILFEEEDQNYESLRIVKLIRMLMKQKGLQYKDIAILYRMSMLSRNVEDAFLKNGIPYQITGGVPFCSRLEIKDIMSYVRIIYNPNDMEAFKRAINTPKRGIGDATIQKLIKFKEENKEGCSFIKACEDIPMKGKAKNGMVAFAALIRDLEQKYVLMNPRDFIKEIINRINYIKYLEDTEKNVTKIEDRIGNLEELMNLASSYTTVEEFLEDLSLNTSLTDEEENEESDNKVRLMTMHASKGLEFPCVICIGCSEGTSPSFRAKTKSEIEEERRLFYVGMTRAEKYLFLLRAKRTMLNGRSSFPERSRFLDEISKDFLVAYNGA